MFTNILLCTHGSEGAQKAEAFIFNKSEVLSGQCKVTVLTIIDKDWSVMTGDDWLNTSTTRNTFMDYVDGQLGREIDEDWQRIRSEYPKADEAKFMKVTGDIEETIAEVATRLGCDLIVIGGFVKKKFRLATVSMAPGLSARISNEKLHPLLPCPLLTVA